MFTGIVQGKAKILNVYSHEQDEFLSFLIQFPEQALKNVSKGASVAINGTCLTVTSFNTELDQASFDVINQTLAKTNLGQLIEGSEVNFERAAKVGDEIGGHQMSGHIWSTAPVLEIEKTEANTEIVIEYPEDAKEYILEKGYIGLNGCSLTIAKTTENSFSICLIPETLEVTTFGNAEIGDGINVEIDPQTQTIVTTVKRYLANQ